MTVAVPSLPANFNPATVAGSTPAAAMVMSGVLPQTFLLNNFNVPQCLENTSNVCIGLLSGNDPAELVSNAPQTVVYHIATAARWSDGVPITAADFVYNWKMQLLVGPTLPATDPLTGYQDISRIDSSNNGKTVTVVFSHPYADWQSLFTNLIPEHIAKNVHGWNTDFSKFTPSVFVSGGPFVISSVTPGKELILSRNPYFWGAKAGVARVIFKVERTPAEMLHALATGSADMATVPPSVKADNTVLASTNLVQSTQPGSVLYQLDFNLADPTMADLSLRQAIAETIDRHQIVSDTVGTLTPFSNVASNHLFPYGFQGSQPNDSGFEQVNLTQARLQIEQAGYTIGSDGIARSTTGAPLVLSLVGPSGNSIVASIEAAIQAQLLLVGVQVSITNIPLQRLLTTRLPEDRYQMAVAPYLMSQFLSTNVQLYTDPVGPAFVNSSASGSPNSASPGSSSGVNLDPSSSVSGAVTRDVTGYSDPAVVQMFAAAAQELNAGSINTYNQIDAAIWASLPSLPLFQMPVTFIHNIRVLNVANSQGWLGPTWNIQNWTIQSHPLPTTTTTLAGS